MDSVHRSLSCSAPNGESLQSIGGSEALNLS